MENWLDRRGALAVVMAQAATAASIQLFGDEGPIPMHFGFDLRPDRFGDRTEAALLAGAMALVALGGWAALSAASRRQGETGRMGCAVAAAVLLGVTSLICGMMVSLAFGLMSDQNAAGASLMALLGAVFAITGAFLGKVGPNRFMGVRTPWSRASRLAWDKSHRLAGRLFFWGGVVAFAAAPVAPQPAGSHVVIAGAFLVALLATFESWRVWRNDPERSRA